MWYLIAGIGWVFLRTIQKKPILPDFLAKFVGGHDGIHPAFQNGAVLVPTAGGIVAVPADTPVMHPTVAAAQGLLSANAAQSLSMALARADTDGASLMGALSAATSGNWGMFDRSGGGSPDYYVDGLGIPRSNSMSRRWRAR